MTDDCLRIVLVEPRESGNVGAAARAMKNFGFTQLVLVGEPRPLDEASVWWASGAEDVVDQAMRVRTLSEALEGVHLAIATSSGRGREEQPNLSPRDVAELRDQLMPAQTMAIVFGRERGGLTKEELDLCAGRATVPTSPEFPVMNLAQAVTLFCYELAGAASALPAPDDHSIPDRATHDEIERAHEGTKEILLQSGFLNPDNPEAAYRELRAWVARSEPTSREVTILLGIIRQLKWYLKQSS